MMDYSDVNASTGPACRVTIGSCWISPTSAAVAPLWIWAVCGAALCALPGAAGEIPADKQQPKLIRIFDSRSGLAPGWTDLGWAPRQVQQGAPASLDLSQRGGWILANPGLSGTYQWLTFHVRAPRTYGDFLEVRLDSSEANPFPRLHPTPRHRRDLADGFTEVRFGLRELNPKNLRFDRIVLQAGRDVGHEPVLVDDVALLAGPRVVRMSIDCARGGGPISPLIYGIGPGDAEPLGATGRRWGGNPTTRYNWTLGNTWNAGRDWFFRNLDYSGKPGPEWERWLEENRRHGVASVITLPTIGWVAKDTTSYSFPVALFGPQQAVAPENPDMGNGVGPDGKLLKPLPPERTSVPAPPEFIARWVAAVREKDPSRNVRSYILDNEPTLWSTTHRDVHPDPVSYDELLDTTIRYGSAVRRADPRATIAGPALWGWTAYFYSAQDAVHGFALHTDRLAHGNVPLLPWWLRKMREYEGRTGVRLIDVLDVHFYPQSDVGLGAAGGTDAATAALRIRSTRALWDPSYVDESWIKEPVRLIPRLREWIAENDPGLGISIGEYNFGAEGHMSGGLAVAEALGRFGQNGVDSAFYWSSPLAASPAFYAFRAFRNFDGKGGHFLDQWVPARSDDPLASIFVSRDAGGGHLVGVALNFDPVAEAEASIELAHCGRLKLGRVFSYQGAPGGFVQTSPPMQDESSLRQQLPPYSMTVLDLELKR
jgi:hypothetical protein